MENNETVFEIKTFAGSRDEAKKIVDNWKNNAEVIYPKKCLLFRRNVSLL